VAGQSLRLVLPFPFLDGSSRMTTVRRTICRSLAPLRLAGGLEANPVGIGWEYTGGKTAGATGIAYATRRRFGKSGLVADLAHEPPEQLGTGETLLFPTEFQSQHQGQPAGDWSPRPSAKQNRIRESWTGTSTGRTVSGWVRAVLGRRGDQILAAAHGRCW